MSESKMAITSGIAYVIVAMKRMYGKAICKKAALKAADAFFGRTFPDKDLEI